MRNKCGTLKKKIAKWRRHDTELESRKTFYISLCKI